MAVFKVEPTLLLSIKILDTNTAATLFVTAVGALLVRRQFVLGLRPRIGYKTARTTKEIVRNGNKMLEVWQVKIRNTGEGSAIINRSEFELKTETLKNSTSFFTLIDVITELNKIGLVRGEDYWLENITSGFALPPQEDCIVFEIKIEHVPKLKRLDMLLHFQGLLGDRYFREIFFIPPGFD